MEKIQRHFQKEDLYRNFRRNMLGHCVDSKYYQRNDMEDDICEVHNAFDMGFICALEKIQYESDLIIKSLYRKEIDITACLSLINNLIIERLAIAFGDNINPQRSLELKLYIQENKLRISDDL